MLKAAEGPGPKPQARWADQRRRPQIVTVFAPAKINLSLRVFDRGESGYHRLETLFQALDLGDTLTLSVREGGLSFSLRGPDLGPDEENLVVRAARMFQEQAGSPCGVDIFLEKRVPVGGGLGGGSSDAAATLKGLSALYPGRVDSGALISMAGELGADVPFFLSPSPLALAWGRGDRLLPIPALPSVPVLLAIPSMEVKTPKAFELLAASRSGKGAKGFPTIIDPNELASWAGLSRLSGNDFEPVIFRDFPLLGAVAEALREHGPRMAGLTGSGSVLFAVFQEPGEVSRATAALQASFPDIEFEACATLEDVPGPRPSERG